MRTTIETIGPVRAGELLAMNTKNRSIKENNVRFIYNQMMDGTYLVTGTPIQVSKSGFLVDGQHRLIALQKSGKEYTFVIVWDVQDPAFEVIDTGVTRIAGDILMIAGQTEGHAKAALARKIMNWQGGMTGQMASAMSQKRAGSNNSVILDFVQKNNLDDYIKFGVRCRKENPSLTPSEWSFLYWLFSQRHTDEAREYLTKLATGAGLPMNHQILNLRNRLLGSTLRGGSGNMRLTPHEKFLLIVASWNWYRKGKESGMVRLSSGEIPEIL